MKQLFTTLLFLITILNCQAQSKFSPGIIVFNNGNKVEGYIDKSKTDVCKFRSKENNQIKEYLANEIEFFRFNNGTKFKSLVLPIDSNLSEMNFVEVLVEGEISLLLAKRLFFVKKKGGKIHQLKEVNQKLDDQYGNKGIRINKKYIGILNYLMSDCSELKQSISRSSLNEKDLTKLVVSYNKCIGVEYTESKSSIPFSKLNLRLFIGISYKKHSLLESVRTESYPSGEYVGLMPQIGTGIEWSSPRTAKNLFFQTFPSFQYFNINTISYQGSINNGSQYDLNLSYFVINIPAGIKYNINLGKRTFFVRAGAAYNIFLRKNMNAEKALINSNNIFLSTEEFPFELSPINVWFGIGYQIESIFGHQATVEMEFDWSDHKELSSHVEFNQLLSATETLTLTFGILF